MKLMVIPSHTEIDLLLENSDAFLFGIDHMSIHFPFYLKRKELDKLVKKIQKNHKEIFISLNKNMKNDDLKLLEEILVMLDNLKIDGIFYYDVAVLNISKRLQLKTPLVWSAEHFTTNYATSNFWNQYGAKYTYLSGEITLDEIIEISKNTSSKLIVPVFGYLPIFASMRHTVSNYLEQFSLNSSSQIHYLNLNEDCYPIVDFKLGTNIYSAHILNAYLEYLQLQNYKIEYVTLNSFLISFDQFVQIVRLYKESKVENKEKIDNMMKNTDQGFFHQETIYRVKKHD